jgi:hypothetical protein
VGEGMLYRPRNPNKYTQTHSAHAHRERRCGAKGVWDSACLFRSASGLLCFRAAPRAEVLTYVWQSLLVKLDGATAHTH